MVVFLKLVKTIKKLGLNLSKKISMKLPSSNPNDIYGHEFEKFIKKHKIIINTSLALAAYQGSNTNTLFLSAQDLNHSLTLKEHGEDSAYAKENVFGDSLDDYEYKKSVDELDNLFNNEAYIFLVTRLFIKV